MSLRAPRADETLLIERAKTDPNAFGELYDRYFSQMYRFCFSRLRDQTAAEDVTSEVFLKALRSIPRYQDTGRPFAAWLYQIAANAVADRYRGHKPTVSIDELFDLGAGGPGLEDLAIRGDEVRRIWQIVETLPVPQRTAMALKFQEDMKLADIAQVMGKTEGAVKLLIHRGVTKVRSSFQERGR